VQGLSAGGEVTSATSFALEHAPPHRRSFWITVVIGTSAVSSIVGLLVVLGLSTAMPDAEFLAWGWRVPFLIALPLSLVGLYIRLRTDESPAFEKAQREKALSSAPVRESLSRNGPAVASAFALASMSGLAFYYLVGYFPTYLQVAAGLSRTEALLTNGVALLAFTVGLAGAGLAGDRFGRRPMIRAGAMLLVVTSVPAFLLAGSGSTAAAVAGQLLLCLSLGVFGGGSYATLLEVFPTRTRLTGAALGYNAGYAIFGGTAPLVASMLVASTGSQYAPGWYLAGVSVLVLVSTWFVPETKGVDIHA
jgi:MHS family proline/betaine transporter-like MFS transporter